MQIKDALRHDDDAHLTAVFQDNLGKPVPECLHSGFYGSSGLRRWWVVTTAAIRHAMLQWNRHHQNTNTNIFTGRMPFPSPNKQRQSTEGRKYHITRTCSPQRPSSSLFISGYQKGRKIPSSPAGVPSLSFTTKGSCVSSEGGLPKIGNQGRNYNPRSSRNGMGRMVKGGGLCRWEKDTVILGPTSADHLILIQSYTYTTLRKTSLRRGAHMVFYATGAGLSSARLSINQSINHDF